MILMENQRRSGFRQMPASVPQGQVIADFTLYLEAVAFVERMIANEFPPQAIAIVGSDLRTVERVRGRQSYGRAALSGIYSGAWVGLAFGLLFGSELATQAAELGQVGSPLAASVFLGAGFGMLVNVIRLSLGSRKRSFISNSMVVASKYQVQVPEHLAAQAQRAGNTTPKPDAV
jgi:hypothetical protein